MTELETTARRLLREVPIEASADLHGEAQRRAARMLRRRRATVGSALVAVVAVIALVAAAIAATGEPNETVRTVDSTTATTVEPGPPVGEWRDMADGPLSPRIKAFNGMMGDEIAIIGGATDPECSYGVDCFSGDEVDDGIGVREATIYDPAADSWREIAQPPVALSSYDQQTFAAGRLLVPRGATGILVYDPAADRWSESIAPPPELAIGVNGAVVMGDILVVPPSIPQAGQPMVTYDPVADTWSTLPADPIGAAALRTLVWTGTTLVLLGIDQPYDDPTPTRVATFDPRTGRWRSLPAVPLGDDGSAWYALDEDRIATTMFTGDGWTDTPRSGTVDLRTGAVGPLPTVTPPGQRETFAVGPALGGIVVDGPEWHRLWGAPARGQWLHSPESQRVHHVPSPVSADVGQIADDAIGFPVGRDLVIWRGLIEERGAVDAVVDGVASTYRLPSP